MAGRPILRGLTLLMVAIGVLAAAACRSSQAAPQATSTRDTATEDESRARGESPALHHPEVAGMRVLSSERLDPAMPAPRFALTNYTGATVALDDLARRVVLLSFVYTNCSEACPLLAGHYLTLQHQMAAAMDDGELALVFVTTDPARDTPENLREYTEGRAAKWYFLTGDLKTLEEVWGQYEIYREIRQGLQDVVVYHSYKTYLIDGRGQIRYRYTGIWQPPDVARDVESLLAERG